MHQRFGMTLALLMILGVRFGTSMRIRRDSIERRMVSGTSFKIRDNLVLAGGARIGKGNFHDLVIDAYSIHFLQQRILMPIIRHLHVQHIDFEDLSAEQLMNLWRIVEDAYASFQADVFERCYGKETSVNATEFSDSDHHVNLDCIENFKQGLEHSIGKTDRSTSKAEVQGSGTLLSIIKWLHGFSDKSTSKRIGAQVQGLRQYLSLIRWLQRLLLRHNSYESVANFMTDNSFFKSSATEGIFTVPLGVWLAFGVGDCRLHGVLGAIFLQQLEYLELVEDAQAVYGQLHNDPGSDSGHMFNVYRAHDMVGVSHQYSFDGYAYPYDAFEIEEKTPESNESFILRNWGRGKDYERVEAVAVLTLKKLQRDLQPRKNMFIMILEMDKLENAPHDDLLRFVPEDSLKHITTYAFEGFKDLIAKRSEIDRQVAVITRAA